MARVSRLQTNFTAGELSNRLYGRPDLAKYQNGAETIENMIVFPHGGVSRRSGTRFVKEVKTSADNTRLIPFEFSTEQAYVLEFGDEYIRFYKDNGAILEAGQTITAATKASPCVITINSHNYNNGDQVYISGVGGMVELNQKYFIVAGKTTNTFQLTDIDGNNIDSSGYTTFTSGGTAARVFTLTSPYDKTKIDEIQIAQSADVLYVAHSAYAPRKISRTGHTSWTIEEIVYEDGPYFKENTTTTTLTPGGTSGSITVTASAVTGINNGDGFQTTDVGRLVRIGHQAAKWAASTSFSVGDIRRNSGNVYECIKAGTSDGSGGPSGDGAEIVDNTVTWKFVQDGGINYGYGKITGRTSTTEVTVEASKNFGGTSAETKWRLGSWSGTTGYPAAVSFFEQRLFWAGSTDEPQTVWGSATADFQKHTPGVLDDDPVVFVLGSEDVNVIRWLSSGRVLTVGTVGGEFVIAASSTSTGLSPTNVRVSREGTRGAAAQRPVKIDNAVLYIQRQERKVRELVYVFNSDSFQSPDLTLLAEQMAYGGISQIVYAQELDSIVWGIRNDGQLVGLTYLRDQDVVAWHRHIIGGHFGDATITVTDYANIAVGTTITVTKSDGTSVVFTSEAISADAPTGTNGWRPNSSNNVTADNIFTAINGHEDFTVANPAANVVTVTETTSAGTGYVTITTSDTTRLATTDQAQAQVTSLATIPTASENQLWMIVKRTVNGVTRQYVEYLAENFNADDGDDKSDGVFVDSSLYYTGSAVSSVSNLDHLEAQTVAVLGNGAVYPRQRISSGGISGLDPTVTKAQVGLPYTSTLKTLRPEAGSEDGTAQGKTQRVFEVTVRFINTLGARFGGDTDNLDEILFRDGSDPMDSSPPLFTGDKAANFHGTWDTTGQIMVIQDQPLPMTISAIVTRIMLNDG